MQTIDPAPGTYDASDGFGNLRPSGRRHTGIDFGVASGTDFPAFASGTVTFSGWEPTGGNGWCLAWKLDDSDYTAAYLHGLKEPPANVGDRIAVGQHGVFISGNSGTNSQGSHVHLTLSGSDRAYQGYSPLYDPWAFIQEHLTNLADLSGDPLKGINIMTARAIRNADNGEIRVYSDQEVGDPTNWVHVPNSPNFAGVLKEFYGVDVKNANGTDFALIRTIATGK